MQVPEAVRERMRKAGSGARGAQRRASRSRARCSRRCAAASPGAYVMPPLRALRAGARGRRRVARMRVRWWRRRDWRGRCSSRFQAARRRRSSTVAADAGPSRCSPSGRRALRCGARSGSRCELIEGRARRSRVDRRSLDVGDGVRDIERPASGLSIRAVEGAPSGLRRAGRPVDIVEEWVVVVARGISFRQRVDSGRSARDSGALCPSVRAASPPDDAAARARGAGRLPMLAFRRERGTRRLVLPETGADGHHAWPSGRATESLAFDAAAGVQMRQPRRSLVVELRPPVGQEARGESWPRRSARLALLTRTSRRRACPWLERRMPDGPRVRRARPEVLDRVDRAPPGARPPPMRAARSALEAPARRACSIRWIEVMAVGRARRTEPDRLDESPRRSVTPRRSIWSSSGVSSTSSFVTRRSFANGSPGPGRILHVGVGPDGAAVDSLRSSCRGERVAAQLT